MRGNPMQRYNANAEYTKITVAPSVGSEDDNHLGGRGSVESATKERRDSASILERQPSRPDYWEYEPNGE